MKVDREKFFGVKFIGVLPKFPIFYPEECDCCKEEFTLEWIWCVLFKKYTLGWFHISICRKCKTFREAWEHGKKRAKDKWDYSKYFIGGGIGS